MPGQVTATDRKGIWREARWIALLGWAMAAALLAAPAMMFALVVSRHLPLLPNALLFLGGAAVGWLVGAGILRFRGVSQVLLWILDDTDGTPLPELAMGVRDGARGQGVGTALVEALASEAADRFRALTLNVHLANPAVRLYMRTGFRVAGKGRGWFGVAMSRSLGS